MVDVYEDVASIPISALTNLLTCSICRDLMNSTHVGMTCMHRFCGTCIEKYITSTQANDRSCPFCRCKIASRRQFKPEPFCSKLIDLLFEFSPKVKSQQFKISEFKELHKTRSAQIFEISKTVPQNYVYVPPLDAIVIPKAKRQKVPTIEVDDDMINLGLRFCVRQKAMSSSLLTFNFTLDI
jgi:hypothetical protein